MDHVGNHVGKMVRHLREERGLNQAQLAVSVGTGPSAISQIENGRRNPNSETLAKLANALEVGVGDLFPKVPGPAQQLELDEQRGAGEEQHYLSALLDPYTKELRRISKEYGPHLRLLPPDPSLDDLGRFSWITEFRRACSRMDNMTGDSAFLAVVSPWLSRMNDETVPADIRQKLRDFDAASTELFNEVEPIAEAWLEAQRERLPDEWLAQWSTEFSHSSEERAVLDKDAC